MDSHLIVDDELLVASVDPDGTGNRLNEWRYIASSDRRGHSHSQLNLRVVTWETVADELGVIMPGLVARGSHERESSLGPSGYRAPARRAEQVLHLLGRHPLLTPKQLAQLLDAPMSDVLQQERTLEAAGYLRSVDTVLAVERRAILPN